MKKKLYLIALVLLLIAVNRFFEYKPLLDFANVIRNLAFFVLLAFIFRNGFYKKGVFVGPIKYIILSMFIAYFSGILVWDQDLFRGILVIAPFSYFFLYFFLVEAKIEHQIIVKTTLSFSYLCLILYTYQFLNPETVLYGFKEEIFVDRGILRIGFAGEGFLFFAIFYYLNKLGKKVNVKYILLLIPFLWMLLVQVTRMYILGVGLIMVYHFMLKSKILYRIGMIAVFIASYSFYVNSDNVIIKGIRDSATSDIDQKEDYIRLMEVDYFLNDFSKNTATSIFGNGAIDFTSNYGKKILRAGNDNNYYLEDIGLIKGYFLFGILFIVGYLLIYFKSFTTELPQNLLYLKYFIWMMLVLSFTTRAPADPGFGAVFVIVIYLYDMAYLKQATKVKGSKVNVESRLNYR